MKLFIPVAVVATAFATLIGPSGPLGGFWRPSPDLPTAAQPILGGLIAESMIENVAFGIGIAIALLGYRWFAARTPDRFHALAAWLASVWLLASWMPHGSLHRHIGLAPRGLLPVEWIFHGGAIVAVAALLWALLAKPVGSAVTPSAVRGTTS